VASLPLSAPSTFVTSSSTVRHDRDDRSVIFVSIEDEIN
jgi:hypothetical protein